MSKHYNDEGAFQADVRKDIEARFPNSYTYKVDAGDRQGSPDLLVLYKNKWAMLECKKAKDAKHQPNQDYYVNEFNNMSFSAFIYPENKEEVLDELQRSFEI